MRYLSMPVLVAAAILAASQPVRAAPFWATTVTDYSSEIQNFGVKGQGDGDLMTPATEFWVLGPPDAAVNDTGDGLDPDFVAGWRSNAPGEYIVVNFALGLADAPGDDLTIRMFSGPSSGANVLASVDGVDFTGVGTLGPGTPLELRDETFDFAGQFVAPVRYLRVERVANGPQTGMFFDAFGGNTAVPEPGSLWMIMPFGILLARWMARRQRRRDR